VFAFSFRSLKRHLPLVDDIVAIRFLAKVPRDFARIYRSYRERFGVFINIMVKSPFEAAWALPEFNGIGLIRAEELPQFMKDCSSMYLERMRFTIKNLLCCMNRVHYNDDLGDVVHRAGLVDTTPDSKQFCFSTCYKRSVVNCFD